MKKSFIMLLVAFLSMSVFVMPIFASSSANSAKPSKDTTGYWNENDIQQVCENIIAQILDSPRIEKFTEKKGRKPFVVVGRIKNESSERIDTRLIAKKLQNAIIESEKMEFVADKTERPSLEEENESDKTIGADFMLNGNVKSLVTNVKNMQQRTYYVTIQLVDIESGKIVFSGEEQISKLFRTANKHY